MYFTRILGYFWHCIIVRFLENINYNRLLKSIKKLQKLFKIILLENIREHSEKLCIFQMPVNLISYVRAHITRAGSKKIFPSLLRYSSVLTNDLGFCWLIDLIDWWFGNISQMIYWPKIFASFNYFKNKYDFQRTSINSCLYIDTYRRVSRCAHDYIQIYHISSELYMNIMIQHSSFIKLFLFLEYEFLLTCFYCQQNLSGYIYEIGKSIYLFVIFLK